MGYLKAKGRDEPVDKLIVPKGPLPDIQTLEDGEVFNGK